jgi:hypothetical protein
MTIKGTVTRLVEAGNDKPPRVFFRPEDPAVLKELDGSKYLTSGEIAVPADIKDYEVGEEVEFEV